MEFKAVEEDFVVYSIYSVDPALDVYALRNQCLSVLEPQLTLYLWHQDPFVLNVNIDKKWSHLSGRVTIGDNIEDEWFIISLIFKLTEELPVIACINDQDGEVLLIEAADYLPKWAQEPELSENRVYVYQGAMHLIPIAQSPAQLTPIPAGCPDIHAALSAVTKYRSITQASKVVQKAIKGRLKQYPHDWSDHLHYAHAIVPTNLRCVLKRKPQLASAAIRCFYSRDTLDLKGSRLMRTFNPTEHGLTKIGFSFTKCLYAMLVKQQFVPDKRAGWPTLAPSDPDFCASALGAKLACGFQILVSSKLTARGQTDLFEAYVQQLTDKGYFQMELKGSKKYKQLLEQAKQHFDDNETTKGGVKTPRSELIDFINDAKKGDFSSKEDTLLPEDDDSWMDLQPETFDEMLKAHFKLKDDVKSEPSKRNEDIPSEVKNFLKTMSDLSGVEDDQGDNKAQHDDSKEGGSINFDADAFEDAMKKMIGVQISADESGSSAEEEEEEEDDDDIDDLDGEMSDYFTHMSDELKGTKVTSEEDNESDWTQPLNVDASVLANLLESYNSQGGMPGPASTLLEPLGFNLMKH
jgi:hypothetical protein